MTADVHTELLHTYRDDLRKVSPTWLQRGLAEAILYSMGVHVDALADALVAGMVQRFPGAYSFESLALLGRERRIERGIHETDAAFAQRLTLWLLAHQKRGGPYALLGQLYYHYSPDLFPIDLVYANGRSFHLDPTQPLEQSVTRSNTAFAPDGDTAKWARWWLIYYTDRWASTPPTEAEIADLRLVPRAWNAAHPNGTIIIMSSGTELFDALDDTETWDAGEFIDSGGPLYIEVDPV